MWFQIVKYNDAKHGIVILNYLKPHNMPYVNIFYNRKSKITIFPTSRERNGDVLYTICAIDNASCA